MTWPPGLGGHGAKGHAAAPGRVAVKVCGITRAEDARLAAALGASAVGFVFWSRSPRAIPVEAAAAIVRGLPPCVAAVGVFVDQPLADVIETARRVPLDIVQLHGDEPLEYVAAVPGRVLKAVPVGPADAALVETASPDRELEAVTGTARGGPARADGEPDHAGGARSTARAPSGGTARSAIETASASEGGAGGAVRGPGLTRGMAGVTGLAARVLAWPPRIVPLIDAADPVRRGGTGRASDWELARRLAAARPIVLAGGLDAANVCRAVKYVRPCAVDVSSGVEARPGVKDPDRLRAFFAGLETAGLLARAGHARPA